MKIVIGTGGSGGHLFPALKVAEELKRQSHEVVFIGSFRDGALETIQNSGFSFENLSIQGFTAENVAKIFSSARLMCRGYGQSRQLLKKFKPQVVVGFGGYGSFPVVLAAIFLRIPTLIHEQNVIAGRANKILAKGVNRIAVSFPQAEGYFRKEKVILTGCPCHVSGRKFERETLLKEFNFEHDRMTLLVLGGSQGSHRINEIVFEAIKILKAKQPFQVIHLTGAKDYSQLKIRYQELGIPFALFAFLDKMEEAYSLADLVISRAGAVTVTEIAMARLPAILIPYPFAGGHQMYNAKVLNDVGTARIVNDKELSASRLVEDVLGIVDSPQNFQEKFKAAQNLCFPDAAIRLASEIVQLGLTKNN